MIAPSLAAQIGLIPLKRGPVRFAVGPPDGLTSNAWRIWTTKHGDVYIVCRDNFKEVKVSLHSSGRWRMGFTTEAVAKNPNLLQIDQNRAWDVWDQPPASLPKTIIAFRLPFPTAELTVRPEQRIPSEWKNVIFLEASPPGKLTVVTLFVTIGDVVLTHGSEPSFCLASLPIDNLRRVQLVVHSDPEGNLPDLIERSAAKARIQAESAGVEIPSASYVYFFGIRDDGSRYIVGARMNRSKADRY